MVVSEWAYNLNFIAITWLETYTKSSTLVSMINGIQLAFAHLKKTQFKLCHAMRKLANERWLYKMYNELWHLEW
jgi:hypothetical protein